jgi:hypothetical protein
MPIIITIQTPLLMPTKKDYMESIPQAGHTGYIHPSGHVHNNAYKFDVAMPIIMAIWAHLAMQIITAIKTLLAILIILAA